MSTLTLDKLLASWDAVKEAVGPDPLAEYMTERGFNPEEGGRMLFPASALLDWGPYGPPWYVRVTYLVEKCYLYKVPPPVFPDPETRGFPMRVLSAILYDTKVS